MTVTDLPSSCTCLPTMLGSPPKRFIQYSCVSTITGGTPGPSSLGAREAAEHGREAHHVEEVAGDEPDVDAATAPFVALQRERQRRVLGDAAERLGARRGSRGSRERRTRCSSPPGPSIDWRR